ncbi:MAG: cell division protease FtsH [Nocardioidaceae bacterium]|nr:cell division protease FtsH [Nocardioidaceae bacterium]
MTPPSYSRLSARRTLSPASAEEEVRPELQDIGRLARRVVRRTVRAARADEEPTLTSILRDHLGGASTERAVVDQVWPMYEHVNVQAGIDAWLREAPVTSQLVGVVDFRHQDFGLAELLSGSGQHGYGPRPGNVARTNLASGPDGEVAACVLCGLYLATEGETRAAVLLRRTDPHEGGGLTVQVVATDDEYASGVAAEIRRLAGVHNVFRNQVLSFDREIFGHGETLLSFHRRPVMGIDQLIMPEQTLATVQRQVVDVARHKQRLLDAGQHLKRGLLLYGPPGVGKTHTVRYLIASLTDTTVISLTGGAMHLIAEACSVARALEPAMVVVEDVDLIAEDRGMHPGQHPLLFQLLNEMDGLAADADVVFVLTTNRADLLEPALAARPGRVDQAVELTMPDLDARRRLFELYRGALEIDTSGLDAVLARTEGVTASFLKELMRRAAVLAAADADGAEGPLAVSSAHLESALDELLDTRNAMTRVLLGAERPGAPPPGFEGARPGLAPGSGLRWAPFPG